MPDATQPSAPRPDAGDAPRSALADRIARWTGTRHKLETAIPNLSFSRWETPTEPASYTLEASVCLIAQGAKRVLLGEEEYEYDAHHFLITSIDLPVVARIIKASEDRPYLGLMLRLDQREVSQLVVERPPVMPRMPQPRRGMAVSEVPPPLLGAFLRLVDLLDAPEEIPVLAPLIQKEIVYRLLMGEQGHRLMQIAAAGSRGQQVSLAVRWLKEHYARPLCVNDLAAQAGMSASAFHHHFRQMTSMSPLQFQKWLRLHEARRLMLTERLDAATAAFNVGYESPSQFSREYSRQFGTPPLRDIRNLSRRIEST